MKRMDNTTYWEMVKKIKFHEICCFFGLIFAGWLIYDLTDFVFIRWLSANTASFWVMIFGHPESIVNVVGGEVYIFPIGPDGFPMHFVKGCTPAAGIFPLTCLFCVPHTSLKIKARNYALYLTGLFFVMEFVNGVEIILHVNGMPWSVAHDQGMNSIITWGIIMVALSSVFTIWPESTMPFAFIPSKISSAIKHGSERDMGTVRE